MKKDLQTKDYIGTFLFAVALVFVFTGTAMTLSAGWALIVNGTIIAVVAFAFLND